MYPVSDAFMQAIESNTRKFYWTGTITDKNGKVYKFGNEDIVKGSGYITRQCCGNSEIELVLCMPVNLVSACSVTLIDTP